jgi:hypothetical protein
MTERLPKTPRTLTDHVGPILAIPPNGRRISLVMNQQDRSVRSSMIEPRSPNILVRRGVHEETLLPVTEIVRL